VSPKQINTYHLSKREHGSQIESERDTILPPCSYHAFESNLKEIVQSVQERTHLTEDNERIPCPAYSHTLESNLSKGNCAICSRKNPSHRRQ